MSDDALDVSRPRSTMYLPRGLDAALAADEGEAFVDHEAPLRPFDVGGFGASAAGFTVDAGRVQAAVDDFTRALTAFDVELLIAAARVFRVGMHGRGAPARGLVEQARRHRRNARGFVPGAHPAARPMHEAYRARRRRRSGRR